MRFLRTRPRPSKSGGGLKFAAFKVMRRRIGWYDPTIREAFAEVSGRGKQEVGHDLRLNEIVTGMLFGEDVKSEKHSCSLHRARK